MKIQTKRLARFASIVSFLSIAPLVVSAQASPTCDPRGGLYNILCRIHDLLGTVVPLLIALGVVYFVYGVVMYMIADDEEAKTKGRDSIIFGVIGLAVIISLWGLVYIVTATFRTEGNAPTNSSLQKLIPERGSTGGSGSSSSGNMVQPGSFGNPKTPQPIFRLPAGADLENR
jgi:hypothetical protein